MATRGFEVTTGLVIQQGIWEDSSTAKHKLGTRMQLADGRVFYYALNGAVAGVAGTLAECLPAVAGHYNVNCSAAAIGDQSINVTITSTAATANQYAEGYLHVQDGTGEGHYYKIKSNTAASASGTVTVTLYDPIRVATVASGTSEVSMTYNPYYKLVKSATVTNMVVGIYNYVVTASYYFWTQTWGPAVVLGSAAISAVGEPLAVHTTDGSVGYNYQAITSQAEVDIRFAYERVGVALGQITVSEEYTPIFLKINC